MRDDVYMGEAKYSIFGDRQREVIKQAKEQNGDVPTGDRVRNANHRMRHEVCTSQNLMTVLHTFIEDLDRVEEYYRYVREYPGGVYDFEENVLPPLGTEIERLIQTLKGWQRRIDSNGGNRVQYAQEVESVYRKPLFDGLSHFPLQLGDMDELDEQSSPEIKEDREEARKREKCLVAMFRDKELFEMLEFMATEPANRKLPARKKGGQVWKYWIGRFHERRYGLVEDDPDGWRPKLTNRGNAVYAAASALLESEIVKTEAEKWGKNRHEVALLLLSHYCTLPEPNSVPNV